VIYDGICRLCSGSVKFLLSIDKRKVLKFTTLTPIKNSDPDVEKINNFQDRESILYIENKILYTESEAVIRIFNRIGGLWKIAMIFLIIPSVVRNFFYRLIARNRYKIFGVLDSCELPGPEYAGRFIPEISEAELQTLMRGGDPD